MTCDKIILTIDRMYVIAVDTNEASENESEKTAACIAREMKNSCISEFVLEEPEASFKANEGHASRVLQRKQRTVSSSLFEVFTALSSCSFAACPWPCFEPLVQDSPRSDSQEFIILTIKARVRNSMGFLASVSSVFTLFCSTPPYSWTTSPRNKQTEDTGPTSDIMFAISNALDRAFKFDSSLKVDGSREAK